MADIITEFLEKLTPLQRMQHAVDTWMINNPNKQPTINDMFNLLPKDALERFNLEAVADAAGHERTSNNCGYNVAVYLMNYGITKGQIIQYNNATYSPAVLSRKVSSESVVTQQQVTMPSPPLEPVREIKTPEPASEQTTEMDKLFKLLDEMKSQYDGKLQELKEFMTPKSADRIVAVACDTPVDTPEKGATTDVQIIGKTMNDGTMFIEVKDPQPYVIEKQQVFVPKSKLKLPTKHLKCIRSMKFTGAKNREPIPEYKKTVQSAQNLFFPGREPFPEEFDRFARNKKVEHEFSDGSRVLIPICSEQGEYGWQDVTELYKDWISEESLWFMMPSNDQESQYVHSIDNTGEWTHWALGYDKKLKAIKPYKITIPLMYALTTGIFHKDDDNETVKFNQRDSYWKLPKEVISKYSIKY